MIVAIALKSDILLSTMNSRIFCLFANSFFKSARLQPLRIVISARAFDSPTLLNLSVSASHTKISFVLMFLVVGSISVISTSFMLRRALFPLTYVCDWMLIILRACIIVLGTLMGGFSRRWMALETESACIVEKVV